MVTYHGGRRSELAVFLLRQAGIEAYLMASSGHRLAKLSLALPKRELRIVATEFNWWHKSNGYVLKSTISHFPIVPLQILLRIRLPIHAEQQCATRGRRLSTTRIWLQVKNKLR